MKKIVFLLTAIFLSGCATVTYRSNETFKTYFNESKVIAVMPPDMKIHQLTAGDVPELIDEWGEDAKAKILRLIKEELNSMPSVKVDFIDDKKLDEKNKDLLKEQTGLYRAVAYSIVAHTYDPNSLFQHKIKNFDYTLGSEVSSLSQITKADALLFCSGTNYIWTAGRVMLSTFSFLMGAATGIFVIVPAGPESLTLSLVDSKTGNVLWFDYIPMPGDLREEDLDRNLIKRLFGNFPQRGK